MDLDELDVDLRGYKAILASIRKGDSPQVQRR
jgi:hypothetical protein